MPSADLVKYLQQYQAQGYSLIQLKKTLLSQGYQKGEVEAAIAKVRLAGGKKAMSGSKTKQAKPTVGTVRAKSAAGQQRTSATPTMPPRSGQVLRRPAQYARYPIQQAQPQQVPKTGGAGEKILGLPKQTALYIMIGLGFFLLLILLYWLFF